MAVEKDSYDLGKSGTVAEHPKKLLPENFNLQGLAGYETKSVNSAVLAEASRQAGFVKGHDHTAGGVYP
ncbi:MAG: hypothetical protein A2784_01710 [Candidatus Chisholmbacteria bacterium RIFCSPHIGHO2_01_FULL_48_12]|uniref:Uncharacterized protein n=1 Tax=Candidatus Chisholmbacteria bacterium RIFCSPHIGHO2_01_FULL_48_12 TaxID=1797589 RepID=A0A1G1VR71_9BACT|nr:MAG: hypothetical protein A2784_01710 [Candidatus Chisholmbacteria bacterium RIFCSPHIGHO2_01_FULL_48_12]